MRKNCKEIEDETKNVIPMKYRKQWRITNKIFFDNNNENNVQLEGVCVLNLRTCIDYNEEAFIYCKTYITEIHITSIMYIILRYYIYQFILHH